MPDILIVLVFGFFFVFFVIPVLIITLIKLRHQWIEIRGAGQPEKHQADAEHQH